MRQCFETNFQLEIESRNSQISTESVSFQDFSWRRDSLGCMFAVSEKNLIADPEATIIESLEFFWKDKKIFTMLLGLLKHRIHQLINVKRLSLLSRNIETRKKIVLSVLLAKVANSTGDKRFQNLSKELRSRGQKIKIPAGYQDEFYIKRRCLDRDFKAAGLRVANFFDDNNEQKQKPLKRIFQENLWLKIRAIVGPEYRADAIFLRLTGRSSTQTEAAKILGCHKSSISRVWASIGDIDAISSI